MASPLRAIRSALCGWPRGHRRGLGRPVLARAPRRARRLPPPSTAPCPAGVRLLPALGSAMAVRGAPLRHADPFRVFRPPGGVRAVAPIPGSLLRSAFPRPPLASESREPRSRRGQWESVPRSALPMGRCPRPPSGCSALRAPSGASI